MLGRIGTKEMKVEQNPFLNSHVYVPLMESVFFSLSSQHPNIDYFVKPVLQKCLSGSILGEHI